MYIPAFPTLTVPNTPIVYDPPKFIWKGFSVLLNADISLHVVSASKTSIKLLNLITVSSVNNMEQFIVDFTLEQFLVAAKRGTLLSIIEHQFIGIVTGEKPNDSPH